MRKTDRDIIMGAFDYSNVGLVLAEPSRALRDDLLNALVKEGFRKIHAVGNLLGARQALAKDGVQLLIGDTKLAEGELSEVVYEVRHGRFGKDPFLVVIILVSNPSQDLVRRVINSGPDDVLLKPVTPEQLIDRIRGLSRGRKKFVVTTEYIGPDRRTKDRPGTMEISLLDVPNPLMLAATGQLESRHQQRSRDAAVARINQQKVERHAFQVGFLVDRIVLALEAGEGILLADLEHLRDVAEDISRRVASTPYRHIAELCLTLSHMTTRYLSQDYEMDERDRMLLRKLAEAIRRGVEPEPIVPQEDDRLITVSVDTFLDDGES